MPTGSRGRRVAKGKKPKVKQVAPKEVGVLQARIPASCPVGFQVRYTVKSGDTLFNLAERFRTTTGALADANPHITNPDVLFPDDVLCVPGETEPGGRVPAECPPGTEQRYTVQQGDTFISIARKFRVGLEVLLAFNPHITNPNVLFPGDVLCIPMGRPLLPCCVYLSVRELDARGSALVEEFGELGQFSVGVLVLDLPAASEFGEFDAYQAEVVIPDIADFNTRLFPVEEEPTLLAGRLVFSLPNSNMEVPPETQIWVRPFNTETDEQGPVILRGSLAQCVSEL